MAFTIKTNKYEMQSREHQEGKKLSCNSCGAKEVNGTTTTTTTADAKQPKYFFVYFCSLESL